VSECTRGDRTSAESEGDEVLRRADQRFADVSRRSSLRPCGKAWLIPGARQQPPSGSKPDRLTVLGAIIFASLQSQCGAGFHSLLLAVFTRLIPRLAAGQKPVASIPQRASRFENLMTILPWVRANAEVPSVPGPALRWHTRFVRASFLPIRSQRPLVLEDLSADHRGGKDHAVVGSSGAGKAQSPTGQRPAFPYHRAGSGRWRGAYAADGTYLAPPRWLRGPGYGALSRHGAGEFALGRNRTPPNRNERVSAWAAAEFAFEATSRVLDTTWGTAACSCRTDNGSALRWPARCCVSRELLILDEGNQQSRLREREADPGRDRTAAGRTTVLMIAHRVFRHSARGHDLPS